MATTQFKMRTAMRKMPFREFFKFFINCKASFVKTLPLREQRSFLCHFESFLEPSFLEEKMVKIVKYLSCEKNENN